MSPTAVSNTFADKPNGTAIDKSTFAPQATGRIAHAWERAPVASKAPRLQGKKVWKKLMRAFGATSEDEKLQQVQAELETAGAGGRKKMRMTSTKTNIRDAEWEGTEWHGFQDDIVLDTKMGFAGEENSQEGDKTARKRRKVGSEDKVITPRKPLRQMALDTEAGEKVEDVLDDEVTIAKRARRAMRKSGSCMSLLSSDLASETATNGSLRTQNNRMTTSPFSDTIPTSITTAFNSFASPSKLSPNKRKLLRSKLSAQGTASPVEPHREPRRLSGALFADAASPSTPPTINFATSTASPMQFGASAYSRFGAGRKEGTPLGTPVRSASAVMRVAPGTAPAKIKVPSQSRTEIEQEMASFFTPIPRLKKVKRRSSPIKSYLQQLLENKEEVVKPTQDAQDERAPTPERDSALSFARDVPTSPVVSSPTVRKEGGAPVALPVASPTAEKTENTADEDVPMTEDNKSMVEQEKTTPEDDISDAPVSEDKPENKVEVHAKLDAVASAVRLDFESVPDLSISRLGSFADDQSEPSYLDDDTDEDVSLIRDEHEEAIISESEEEEDFDPEEQLRLELAASQETASEESDTEEAADVEATEDDDADELMLDAPAPTSPIPEVANSTPAFECSITITAEPISHTSTSEESAIASDSSESSTNSSSNANTSFEDEETAMLLAFVTKNQAKKLSRSASIVSPKPASPLRAALGDVTGNSSPPLAEKTAKSGKVEKDAPASPTKKTRRLNQDTALDTTDILGANEVTEPSSVRRSGRTASKPAASKIPAPPSFIPVRHLGADGTEVKAPKKEKTIEQITKLNTGKNKAGCLQPMVVLKRLKMEEKMSSKSKAVSPIKAASPKKSGANGTKEKKKLVWAEELTAVREFDEKSIVRPVLKEAADKKKEKAEGKKLEDTKKTKVRVGTASERASKAALGMVANGTPAKRKSKDVTGAEKDKKETPAKRVRQPKLRSPKVRVAKQKKDEDVIMG